jgi:hypothetical protein
MLFGVGVFGIGEKDVGVIEDGASFFLAVRMWSGSLCGIQNDIRFVEDRAPFSLAVGMWSAAVYGV